VICELIFPISLLPSTFNLGADWEDSKEIRDFWYRQSFNNSTAPCSTALVEKLTVPHLIKKFTAFYGTQVFITLFGYSIFSQTSQSTPFRPISLRSTSMLSSRPSPVFCHTCLSGLHISLLRSIKWFPVIKSWRVLSLRIQTTSSSYGIWQRIYWISINKRPTRGVLQPGG
jgi:hypothetical protein